VVATGGAGGLLCLGWPEGRREVVETTGPSLAGVGSSGPSRSRVLCPSATREAMAVTTLLWNKSSQTHPRPGGASL
jgi:hypothetical protein